MRTHAIPRRRRRRCGDGKRDKNFVAFSFANILLFISGEHETYVPPDDHRLFFSLQMSRAMLRAEFVAVLRAVM
jgi:hypothetical protein